jgi:Mn-dependent DtxR family transcriptional regulator
MTTLNHNALAILGMILRAQRLGERPPTYSQFVEELGIHIRAVWGHLRRLRKLGLVSFEDYRQGTLRATCEFVPAERR